MIKKIIRNIIPFLFFTAIILSTLVAPALAGDEDPLFEKLSGIAKALGFTPVDTSDPNAAQQRLGILVGAIINAVLLTIGVVFMILIFIAGYSWMQSAGDEAKIKKAKDTIRASIIGILVVSMAYALTRAVGALLSGVGLFTK